MLKGLFAVFSAKISGYLKGLKSIITGTQGAATSVNQSAGQMRDSLNSAFSGQLRNNIANLSESISETKDAIVATKAEIIILQDRLKKQKEGTKAFQQTEAAIKNAQKGIKELNLELAEYNIQARNQKKGLADSRLAAEDNSAAIEAVSRSVNAASQALLLFNSTSESTKGITKALSIAMGAVSAVVAIQNLRLRENAIVTNGLARAQALYTAATTGANAATIAFKTTLLTLGVGAVVIALGYLVTKLQDVGKAAEEAENRIKRINNRFKDTEENIQDQIDLIDKQVTLDQKRARIAGKTEDDLLKIRVSGYNKQIALLRQLSTEVPKLGEKLFKEVIKQGGSESAAYEKRRLFEKDITKKINDQILDIQNSSINAELDLKITKFNESKKLAKKASKEEIREIKKTAKANEQIAINEIRLNTLRLANATTDSVQKQKIINAGESDILDIREKYLLQIATAEQATAEQVRQSLTQLAIDRINLENDNNAKLKAARDKNTDELEKAANTENLITKESVEGQIKKKEELYSVLRAGAAKEYLNGQKNEEQYNIQLLELASSFAQDKLRIYKKGSKEYLDAVEEAANAEIALNNAKKDELTKQEKEYAKKIDRIITAAYRQLGNTITNEISDAISRGFEGTSETAQLEIDILKAQQQELEQSMKDATKSQLQMLQERRQYLENEQKLAEATESNLSKLFKGILNGVADFLQQLGVGLIAAAIATEAFQQLLISNPPAAIAAGAAAIIAAAGVRSVLAKGVAFANGGIVSGPTLGLVGEYPGASTNPEVIAPLDKLKNLIGGSQDSGGFVAETRISGRDLAIVLNRYNKDLQRG